VHRNHGLSVGLATKTGQDGTGQDKSTVCIYNIVLIQHCLRFFSSVRSAARRDVAAIKRRGATKENSEDLQTLMSVQKREETGVKAMVRNFCSRGRLFMHAIATCYLLPATCYLLPATCYLLPATCYLLPSPTTETSLSRVK
jgi:hypothetical protein